MSTLLTNLKAYWKLDELSGTSAADASGNGNNGTLQTNASFISGGKINRGLLSSSSLSTTGGYDVGSIAALDISSFPLTISGWFRTSVSGSQLNGGMNILATSKTSSNYSGVALWMVMGAVTGDRGKMRFNYRNNSGTDFFVQTTGTYNDGNWHFAVARISSGGAMTLYVDNVLVGTGTTASGTMFTSTKKMTVGTNWDLSNNSVFAGDLDEIGFWDKEVTLDEATALWNGGLGLTYPFVSQVFSPSGGVAYSAGVNMY